MRRLAFLSSLLAVFLAAAVLLATDGPLTPIAQLRGRTDQNGYLLASSGISGGTDGPLTPIGQLRGRTEQNGYLRVALAGSSSLTGLTVTQGTLTADAQAVSSTATWNNGAVAFTHWKAVITDTASAAGSLAVQILGGAAGATNLLSLTKGGNLNLGGTLLTLGGTTSSFPAIKQNGANIDIRKADDSAYTVINASSFQPQGSGGTYGGGSSTLISNTAPSSLSACGGAAAPSFAWTNGTASFEIITGGSAPVATCTWTMPAAANKWVCDITDITTQTANVFVQKMSASSSTSVTMTNYNTAGAATAVVASDHLLVKCLGG